MPQIVSLGSGRANFPVVIRPERERPQIVFENDDRDDTSTLLALLAYLQNQNSAAEGRWQFDLMRSDSREALDYARTREGRQDAMAKEIHDLQKAMVELERGRNLVNSSIAKDAEQKRATAIAKAEDASIERQIAEQTQQFQGAQAAAVLSKPSARAAEKVFEAGPPGLDELQFGPSFAFEQLVPSVIGGKVQASEDYLRSLIGDGKRPGFVQNVYSQVMETFEQPNPQTGKVERFQRINPAKAESMLPAVQAKIAELDAMPVDRGLGIGGPTESKAIVDQMRVQLEELEGTLMRNMDPARTAKAELQAKRDLRQQLSVFGGAEAAANKAFYGTAAEGKTGPEMFRSAEDAFNQYLGDIPYYGPNDSLQSIRDAARKLEGGKPATTPATRAAGEPEPVSLNFDDPMLRALIDEQFLASIGAAA